MRPLLRWRGAQAGPGGLGGVRDDRRDVALLREQLDDFAPDVVTVWGMSGVSRALLPALRATRRRSAPGSPTAGSSAASSAGRGRPAPG